MRDYDYSAYDLYVKDAQRFPLLERKDEIRLSKIIIGDEYSEKQKEEAIKELVESNLFLVLKFANGYKRRNSSSFPELRLMDLIEEGNLGLMSAAKSFNHKYGKFSTYASISIKRKLWSAYGDNRLIRIPACHSEILYKINRVKRELIDVDHAEISEEELSEHTGYKEARIKDVVSCGAKTSCYSLDAPLGENNEGEESLTLIDAYVDESAEVPNDTIECKDIRNNLFERLKDYLSANEQKVILMKYFSDEDVTLKDMGEVLGLTRERIRQILAKALRKLRKRLGDAADLSNEMDNLLEKKGIKHRRRKEKKRGGTLEYPLTYDECSMLASEIRECILDGKGATLKEYVKRAKKVRPELLGYRKIKAIYEDPFLNSFMPDRVLNVLRKREDLLPKFNSEDDEFLKNNIHRGSSWLAKRFYTSARSICKRARRIGVRFRKERDWTKEDEFIKANTDKTATEIGKLLGVERSSIIRRSEHLGIDLSVNSAPVDYFTPEEDNFIKENREKGAEWLSEHMNRTRPSILSRARKIKTKIAIINNGAVIKMYTPREDRIIRECMMLRGVGWVAKRLNRTNNSVTARARKLKVKVPNGGRVYTPEEDILIRDNLHRGYTYVADMIGVHPKTIKSRASVLGISKKNPHGL